MVSHTKPMRLVKALATPILAVGLLAGLPLISAELGRPAGDTNAPSLGAAANVVILGGAGVSCTSTAVTGNVSSKLTVTKSPTCSISGDIHQGDASAAEAFSDFLTAYTDFKAMPCPPAHNLTGQALGGKTLAPGVYCFNTTADLSKGNLTLAGPSSGTWVFRVGSGITTGGAAVIMASGGQACNVYWALGTNGTIGADTKFQGNILAGSSVTFTGANSSLVGAALAKTAVTMTGTRISGCGGAGGKPRR